ncbi:MAG TPA: short-chain dehydrogenase [Micromonosporaceae bacterium]|nr:short-chain dehydrogenase [Micromonosporaceae bacterium]HCU50108.1 short-chain dehydrogenase [Micromonosporaceae bacterium]
MPTAIVTGASRGLGLELARVLLTAGWQVIADARSPLTEPGLTARQGDVTDPRHREELLAGVQTLDLLINNAGTLGPSPLPFLNEVPVEALRAVYEANVIAPLALTQLALPLLRKSNGILVNVTSDAAPEAYPGWGAYGSSKAALEALSRVLAVEEEGVTVWQVDPGDLRTQMQQDAYPGEDISDRALPSTVAPGLLKLLAERPPSGRYRLPEWA